MEINIQSMAGSQNFCSDAVRSRLPIYHWTKYSHVQARHQPRLHTPPTEGMASCCSCLKRCELRGLITPSATPPSLLQPHPTLQSSPSPPAFPASSGRTQDRSGEEGCMRSEAAAAVASPRPCFAPSASECGGHSGLRSRTADEVKDQ